MTTPSQKFDEAVRFLLAVGEGASGPVEVMANANLEYEPFRALTRFFEENEVVSVTCPARNPLTLVDPGIRLTEKGKLLLEHVRVVRAWIPFGD